MKSTLEELDVESEILEELIVAIVAEDRVFNPGAVSVQVELDSTPSSLPLTPKFVSVPSVAVLVTHFSENTILQSGASAVHSG